MKKMKKLILSSLIVTMLFFGGTANAGMIAGGGVVVITGSGLAFAVAALSTGGAIGGTFGSIIVNFMASNRSTVTTRIVFTSLFVFLDENHQVMEFGPINPSSASKCNLTEDEMNAYNNQLVEVNIAYDEFSKRYYNDKMTEEEAIAAYNKVATDVGLSSGARNAFSKISAHALGLTKQQSK